MIIRITCTSEHTKKQLPNNVIADIVREIKIHLKAYNFKRIKYEIEDNTESKKFGRNIHL